MSAKVDVIKEKGKETAKELIWQKFGSDNATLSDDNIIDVSEHNYECNNILKTMAPTAYCYSPITFIDNLDQEA